MLGLRVRSRRTMIVMLASLILGGGALLGWSAWRWMGPVSPLRSGIAAYEARDWAAAEKVARERLKTHRDDEEALRLLARSLFHQGRDQAALNVQARVSEPLRTADDYFLRGRAAVRLGKKEHGILAWRQALGKDNDHVETLLALEQTFSRLDLLNEAARAAERLAALPGWEARGDLMLGRIRAEQSDPAAAAEALRHALARPDQWHGADRPERIRKQLARLLLRTGRPDQAREAIRQVAGASDDPEACWLLGRCDLQQGTLTGADVSASARSYRDAHPLEPEPAPFVGEAECRDCHQPIFDSQHHSRHARTFVHKERLPTLPVPDRPVADPDSPAAAHTFDRGGGDLSVQTRVEDRVLRTIVDYAFGSGDRGLTLVGHDRENRPFEYRLSHYPDPVGWDVTSGQPRGTGQAALYQGMRITADAVRRCLVCHTTNPRSITTRSGPESADVAIGCERCHGPGGHHLKALAAGADDPAIARPTLADGPAIVGLCGQCHSPRDPELPMIPGTIESVRFQGTTLTWSRCYTEGRDALDCVNCHDPHRNVETSTAWYESRCLDCHSTRPAGDRQPASIARRSARSRPATGSTCPVQPERGCIECHMPRVKIPMAHATFTDHFIRVHREGTTPARK